jgi:hypothetical protein
LIANGKGEKRGLLLDPFIRRKTGEKSKEAYN